MNNPLSNPENWLGSADEPLKGFSWRSGTLRETTGIIFWSDVFLYDAPNGQKTAIILIDTQGLFDTETTSADNSKIFSLSTLFSSIQIINLHTIVQENDLQYLQFATEYAKFTTSNNQQEFKPFQHLMFFIRDWNNPDEYPFGFEGGQRYLDEVLNSKPNQSIELKSVREFIKSSYEKINCFLMPYPGKKVARDSSYDGRWSEMDEDFLAELKNLVGNFLTPANLTTKKINNVEMNGSMLFDYFIQVLTLFQSTNVIQPESIYESTIDKFMMALVAKCFEVYKSEISRTVPSIGEEVQIASVHNSAKEKAFALYNSEKKMGTSQHGAKYRTILDSQMEKDSIEWKALVMANIMRILDEKRRAEEAAREAERLRLQRIEEERIARERIAQLEREAQEREAEAARQREIIRQQEIAVQAELERQRLAEEQRQREIAEQQRIEAERQAEEIRRQQQQHHKKRRRCSVM